MCVFGCVEPERKPSQKRAISPAETSEEALPFQLILYNPVQKDNFSHVITLERKLCQTMSF